MRKTLCSLGLVVALCTAGAAPAVAAPGVPQRPDGPVTPFLPSENGGDNGWGNCGHNSSGGNPPVKVEGHPGNGGYTKGEACGQPGVPPADGEAPGDGDVPETDVPETDLPDSDAPDADLPVTELPDGGVTTD